MTSTNTILGSFRHDFRRQKNLADIAIALLDEPAFTQRHSEHSNPPALLVLHVVGNLLSRIHEDE